MTNTNKICFTISAIALIAKAYVIVTSARLAHQPKHQARYSNALDERHPVDRIM